MSDVKKTRWIELNGKLILLVDDLYKGSPTIMCKYDLLICSKYILNKYKKELIPRHHKDLDLKVKII